MKRATIQKWNRVYVTAALGGVMAITGRTGAQAQASRAIPGDPIAGRQIFVERDCQRCHAVWGSGGTLGPDFAVVGAGRSLQELAGMFWNHTPRMIETVRSRGYQWPTFTGSELADLISYIYYIKLFDEPGDPNLGERWFGEKGCRACHAVGGAGGQRAASLDRYARYIAPIVLAEGMWNHAPVMQQMQRSEGGSMPQFTGREIADLQAYIRRASRPHPDQVELLQPPDPNRGRLLFSQKQCAHCHGATGTGTRLAPSLLDATERLRVSEIAGELWNHSFEMAAVMRREGITFPRFGAGEMADVIAFLYYLRFYDPGGDVRTGEQLFVEKGCVACHGSDRGEGGGPDLSHSESVQTPLGLATAMWDHAPAMYDLAQQRRADWPRFEGDEMRHLSVYLRSLAEHGP